MSGGLFKKFSEKLDNLVPRLYNKAIKSNPPMCESNSICFEPTLSIREPVNSGR